MKKFFSFCGVFSKKKVEDLGKNIMMGIAKWDPETASEAEIEMMIEKFEEITTRVAKAKTEYDREQAEADAAEVAYNQQLQVAERLQKMVEEDPNNAEAAEAFEEVLSTLEELKPELDREQTEAVEAKEILVELEGIAKCYSDKLKTAKTRLTAAKRNMEKAAIREERAQDREERVKELAGLKADTDELGSALSAMEANATASNTKAEASELRAKLLKPTEKKSSKLLDQLSAEVAGTGKPTNTGDRLAALRA